MSFPRKRESKHRIQHLAWTGRTGIVCPARDIFSVCFSLQQFCSIDSLYLEQNYCKPSQTFGKKSLNVPDTQYLLFPAHAISLAGHIKLINSLDKVSLGGNDQVQIASGKDLQIIQRKKIQRIDYSASQ